MAAEAGQAHPGVPRGLPRMGVALRRAPWLPPGAGANLQGARPAARNWPVKGDPGDGAEQGLGLGLSLVHQSPGQVDTGDGQAGAGDEIVAWGAGVLRLSRGLRQVVCAAVGPETPPHAHVLPADHGGSRVAPSGPLLKRSHSVPLPSVHEEISDELSQAQAGDQGAPAPPGKEQVTREQSSLPSSC